MKGGRDFVGAPPSRALLAKPQKYRGDEEKPPPDTDREFFSVALVVKTFVHLIFP
jgi:hypothetical protein